jgi:hypothetical protein
MKRHWIWVIAVVFAVLAIAYLLAGFEFFVRLP